MAEYGSKLGGFNMKELVYAGVFCDDDMPDQITFNGDDIHPLFDPSHFAGWNSSKLEDLLPVIHIASRMLTLPHNLGFFYGLFEAAQKEWPLDGVSIEIPDLSEDEEKKVLMRLQDIGEANKKQKDNLGMQKESIRFHLADLPLNDLDTSAYTHAVTQTFPFSARKNGRDFILRVVSYTKEARAQYLTTLVYFAHVLCHELAHALYFHVVSTSGNFFYDQWPRAKEPRVAGDNYTELGWAWSRRAFGGDFQLYPISPSDPSEPSVLLFIPYYQEQLPLTVYPVSLRYILNMLQREYWETEIPQQGLTAVIPSPVVSRRYHSLEGLIVPSVGYPAFKGGSDTESSNGEISPRSWHCGQPFYLEPIPE